MSSNISEESDDVMSDDTSSTLSLYHNAVTCLAYAAHESQKTSNVDIRMMLSNIKQCCSQVEILRKQEVDNVRSAALDQLVSMLDYQQEILKKKISQLDGREGVKRGSVSQQEEISDDVHAKSRRLTIEDTLISESQLKFDDVAGLSEAKQTLKEAIVIPLEFPHLFTGDRKPWKRILLYGPPGTGKSRLAQALSSEIKSSFYCVSSSDLISSWVGESEKLIKELFVHATHQDDRSVIFIDEIDSICRKRSSAEEEHTRRVKTELLRQMEGADNVKNSEKIFLLCATNCPWELDSAFLRRFQKRIYVPLPDLNARKCLIKIHSANNKVDLNESDLETLACDTEGYSGSDISTVVLGALFQPIRDLQEAKYWCQTDTGMFIPCEKDYGSSIKAQMHELPPNKIQARNVITKDFTKSLLTNRKTVTVEELKKFEKFTTTFGENG